MPADRIPLTPGYHAEPGPTRGDLHDVYTTIPPLGGNDRLHCGELTKAAVDAWAKEAARIRELEAMNASLQNALVGSVTG